jgi:hypothetical protein
MPKNESIIVYLGLLLFATSGLVQTLSAERYRDYLVRLNEKKTSPLARRYVRFLKSDLCLKIARASGVFVTIGCVATLVIILIIKPQ